MKDELIWGSDMYQIRQTRLRYSCKQAGVCVEDCILGCFLTCSCSGG
jgi:hypothetical protein